MILSYAPALNRYALLRSRSRYPLVMGSRQLDVALRVLEGLVAQPLPKDGGRYATEDVVAAVGVRQGVGVGPGGIYAGVRGSALHGFRDPLSGDVHHGAVSVLGVEGS